jgi:hypothetical protein
MGPIRAVLGLGVVVLVVACQGGAPEAAEARVTRSSAPPPACPEPVAARTPLGQRLGERVQEAAAACKAIDPVAHDSARDAQATGRWKGEYQYDDGRAATEIEVSLRVADRDLLGEMSEPNTFGSYGVARLQAAIVGEVFASGQVVFMKTYESGGETHSVLYTGALSKDARRIEGRWRLENASGPFWLAKE